MVDEIKIVPLAPMEGPTPEQQKLISEGKLKIRMMTREEMEKEFPRQGS